MDAIGDEVTASRVTLLTLLGQELAALDTGTVATPLIEAKRQSVAEGYLLPEDAAGLEPIAGPADFTITGKSPK